jgi:hypothetical protein
LSTREEEVKKTGKEEMEREEKRRPV